MIQERGAAAIINVYPADWRWRNLRDGWSKGTNQLQASATTMAAGAMHAPVVEKLFAATGIDAAALFKSAEEKGFRAQRVNATLSAAIETTVDVFKSYNVIGRLAGRGYNGEAVALMAHWDGLGICLPEGAADRICNGAVDNASGTAALLAIAKRLARGPRARRDILFISTGAEEVGLFGAKTFVSDPTIPLEKLVGVLNLDMLALIPSGTPLGVTGIGKTPLDPAIKSVAAALGRQLATGDRANDYLYRLDSFAFHDKGVPAVTAQGFYADEEIEKKFMSGAYHGPDDEYSEDMELGGGADDANFNLALIRALADPKRYQPKNKVAR
jgi:Zn-dependent M28 family amino/carboxypeptidase